MPSPQQLERFWSKVEKGDICWRWTDSLSRGYGTFSVHGKSHPLSGDNLYVLVRNGTPGRYCRACKAARTRAYEKRKAANGVAREALAPYRETER